MSSGGGGGGAGGNKAKPTIVIKRIKKGGHGHHGGAWKIAYADFVTAMMAFFLLMWLLGSTTQAELQGISDFFANPLKVASAGGSGAGDATAIIPGGGTDLQRSTGQVKKGMSNAEKKREMEKEMQERERMEQAKLEKLRADIEAKIAENPRLAEFKNQVKIDITPEGLRIQIVDSQNRPMFDVGKAVMKPYMGEILREIGPVVNDVDKKITLLGHTDASPYAGGLGGYSNWELSADRANASRRELMVGGIEPDRIVRVAGLASSVPYNPDDPLDPMNRRISIIVMNQVAVDRMYNREKQSTAVPDADAAENAIEHQGGAGRQMSPLERLNDQAARGAARSERR
ncbi:flagellar motor protein MotB [Derxia gummosa]|uniref:Flagellar motor protein MotB n=1 Tax=Derxia gummosa DSM 723 TaxID=1121388 RepID=A0A8B6XAH6_9BURK|nr:flagellar motor protein MotB [Derxia gummosa]